MAPSAGALLHPPAGWRLDAFADNLSLELRAHPVAVGTAIALVALLAVGRLLLPVQAGSRLRAALLLLCIYVASLAGRAELLALGHDGDAYGWLALAGALSLSFGIISVVGLIGFDLIARRLGAPRIVRDITIAVASGIVTFALLARSGVDLLQLVTTSAVVTAVIGLALQDTLGNIFAGVALQVDSTITIGDWIRVDDKFTGRVREMRWRSTTIETKDGDIVTFPNAIINRTSVTRFHQDRLQHRQSISFHVHIRHAPNRVIRIVERALRDVPNVSQQLPPECLFAAFDDWAAKYLVRYRLTDFVPDQITDSEVRKRIWYALHREDIEFPYPTSNVKLTQVTPDHDEQKHARDLVRRLKALGKIAFFAPLSEEERRTLAEGLRFMPFADGEAIVKEGDPGDSLYVVREGRVSVRLGVREIAQLGTGDFFGEISLLTGEPRRATVVATDDVECYVVERVLFEGIVKRNPPLAEAVARLLAERERAIESERRGAVDIQRSPDAEALLGRIRRFFGL